MAISLGIGNINPTFSDKPICSPNNFWGSTGAGSQCPWEGWRLVAAWLKTRQIFFKKAGVEQEIWGCLTSWIIQICSRILLEDGGIDKCWEAIEAIEVAIWKPQNRHGCVGCMWWLPHGWDDDYRKLWKAFPSIGWTCYRLYLNYESGWWFGTFFLFHIFGIILPID